MKKRKEAFTRVKPVLGPMEKGTAIRTKIFIFIVANIYGSTPVYSTFSQTLQNYHFVR
jgi:hypothetical protein